MKTIKGLKWSHFQALYDQHLSGKSILELGVLQGASLIEHKKRFQHVFGIDMNEVQVPGCTVYRCNVNNLQRLRGIGEEIVSKVGPLDAIIDDGSHRPFNQYKVFRTLWPFLAEGGMYAIEDLHMARKWRWRFWTALGLPSVPRLLKELNNEQHEWSWDNEDIPRKRPYTIHIYPNIIFIQKITHEIKNVWTEKVV